MKNNSWFTFITGALVGAGITWLFTSKEGKEMVAKMKSKGEDLKADTAEKLADLKQRLHNLTKDVNV
jgi:gas vesicle protein